MEIERLKTFLKVTQYGSFKRVAEHEFLSARAISKQMSQLETELGTRLFERQANQITLTPAGQFFLASAQDVVNNYNKAVTALQDFDQAAPKQLRVGYFSAFEQPLLLSPLTHLLKTTPDLQLTLQELSNEHLMQAVTAGQLDVALSINYGQGKPPVDLETQVVFQGEMMMGISRLNPLSQQTQLTPADLKGQRILYYSPESSTFLLQRFLASVPFITDYDRIQRVTSVEQMRLAVALNQALAFYPAGLVSAVDLAPKGQIKLLPIVGTGVEQAYEIILLTRRGNQNPALKMLVNEMSSNK